MPNAVGLHPGEQYSPLTGLIYVFNLIVGTGCLTLPAAFAAAGWTLSAAGILLLALVSYMTTTWVVESMACANAINHWRRMKQLKKVVPFACCCSSSPVPSSSSSSSSSYSSSWSSTTSTSSTSPNHSHLRCHHHHHQFRYQNYHLQHLASPPLTPPLLQDTHPHQYHHSDTNTTTTATTTTDASTISNHHAHYRCTTTPTNISTSTTTSPDPQDATNHHQPPPVTSILVFCAFPHCCACSSVSVAPCFPSFLAMSLILV